VGDAEPGGDVEFVVGDGPASRDVVVALVVPGGGDGCGNPLMRSTIGVLLVVVV
jgi:hypothetical protein